MFALRIEVPVVAGVVAVEPKNGLRSRLKFDEAGLVVSVVSVVARRYRPLVMLRDIESLPDGNLGPAALGHDDIRTQEAQFSGDEAAAVLE